MKDRRLRKGGYCDASVFPGPFFFKGVKMDHDGIGVSQTSRLC